jgi:hypothetical protein
MTRGGTAASVGSVARTRIPSAALSRPNDPGHSNMAKSSRARPRSVAASLARLAGGLLASFLLAACAGTFRFEVVSTDPAAVRKVYVFFGDAAAFAGKTSSEEIAELVQPDKVAEYYGKVEFEVTTENKVAQFKELSSDLKGVGVSYTAQDKGARLVFDLARGRLAERPKLGLAVVSRTAEHGYRMKVWDHAIVAESADKLTIDLLGDRVGANL